MLVFFDDMDDLIDHPKIDLHGASIPDKEGNVIEEAHKKQSECSNGDVVILIALNQSSKEFLEFLNSREIVLQIKITLKTVETLDHSMLVTYKGHPSETLSQ